jgi:hypothetical protein
MRLAFAFLAIVATSAAAQETLHAGSLVRLVPIERHDVRRQGYVVSLTNDSILVRFAPVPEWELRGDLLTVSAERLEVRTAIKRRKLGGAVIGGAIGMFGGFAVGKSVGGQLCGGNPYYGTQTCHPDTTAEAPLAILGGIAGAGIGALAGWFAKSERWVPARLAR